MNWIALFLSLTVAIAPGFVLGLALLKGVQLARWEKFFLALCAGMIVVPLMCFLEFFLFGAEFGLALIFINALLALAAGIAAMYLQRQFPETLPDLPKVSQASAAKWLKTNWVPLLVILFALIGFYVRFATAHSTTFFEFDPYYYDKLTQEIVRNGHAEMYSSDAYYPEQAFRRYAPLVQYVQGSWYSLYELFAGLGGYSQENLILVAQLYPPIVAALLSILAFMLVKDEFNEIVGLASAAFFALTPQLIQKLAAGVNEQQPWGFFTAMLIFALLILAVNRKSLRLAGFAALACVASALGSQQYVWPFMIVGAYLAIQAVLDFLAGKRDWELAKINAIVVAGAWIGSFIVDSYQNGHLGAGIGFIHYLMLAGLVVSAFFNLALGSVPQLSTFKARLAALFAFFLLCIPIAFVFTGFGSTAVGVVERQLVFAQASNPLAKTIQEEGVTSEAMWASSYGVLNPRFLLLSAALLAAATATLDLVLAKRKKLALGLAALVTVMVMFNGFTDGVLAWLAQAMGGGSLSSLVEFYASNDVFLYMLVAMAASIVSYAFAKHEQRSAVLFVLVFFPIAFIGLNKLKYQVHLAFALCLVAGYVLGEAALALSKANEWLKVVDAKSAGTAALALVLLVAAVGVFAQAQAVPNSMASLASNRIPSDWTETFKWMASSMPQDSRIMSWWDYGHWTTFFGERNTVLDPVNEKGLLNQGVAKAFVDGNDDDIYTLMSYHNATHVMLDWELVGKWGALVYLSGTCSQDRSFVCPVQPQITDWKQGPGKSRYEAEHYFEELVPIGACPTSGPTQLPAYQSNPFGAVYCATQDSFLLYQNNGLNETYQRKFQFVSPGMTMQKEYDYLSRSFTAANQVLNVNPDLSVYGLDSKVYKSAFARLFFTENFPGFKLVYKSPNELVKVFEYEGRPAATPVPSTPPATPAPSATPSPTLEPSVTPSATPSLEATPSVSANAS
ncbi:hypothetical protein COX86_04140 [Candidatus Micrarchaeota archaeon CG_4_10_14_0_2_um_filter_60_11]|nr:MAG: hypothetical protein AUJ16_00745 [Candidatus Micrarchaeota archaeon CG1_02_60_51]PIN96212.1 MAG: hypothetical protein COU39_02265 [Candidatus Micrarchaeota archaeon CG10_big_fil_rev_8_21_14_0_10_60_32]PIO01568.1 MAG: hypothetical protein COT58_04195 [Candidatus Micrarchaeota archaeon CG09_land_8_20_14_0_10_60_16]PIY91111.1 MAG: hypothetical protein COY71_04925 [Candidatus Micrarchaeota archaeon CG_4_10_14_0_8_um_filter_60_7]PIZ90604.1 MAG: hypothetical protein COX86_04140 [Candidatus Mi